MKINDILSGKYWTGLVFALIGISNLSVFINVYPLSDFEKIFSFSLAILALICSIPIGIKLEVERLKCIEQSKISVAIFVILVSFGIFWIGFNFVPWIRN